MANDSGLLEMDRASVLIDKRLSSAYQRVLDACDAQKPIEYYTKRPDIEKQDIEHILFHTFEKKVENIVAEAIKKNENSENSELRKEDVIPSLFSLLEKIEQFNSHTTGRSTSDLSFDLTFARRYREHICYVIGNLEEYIHWLRPLYQLPQNNAITKERYKAFFSNILDFINAPVVDVEKIRKQPDVETAAIYVETLFKEEVERCTFAKLYTNMPLDEIGKRLGRLAQEVEKFDPTLAAPYKTYLNYTIENMPEYEAHVRALYGIPAPSVAPVQRPLVSFVDSDSLEYNEWFAEGEEINRKNECAIAENMDVIALKNVIRKAKKPATMFDGILRTAGYVMMAGAAVALVGIGAFFGYTKQNKENVYVPQETVAVVQNVVQKPVAYTNIHPDSTIYTSPKIGHPESVKMRNNSSKTAPEMIPRSYEVAVPISVEHPNVDSLSLVRPARVQVIDRRLEKICEKEPIEQTGSSRLHYNIYCGLL